jgi:hypothetical protein
VGADADAFFATADFFLATVFTGAAFLTAAAFLTNALFFTAFAGAAPFFRAAFFASTLSIAALASARFSAHRFFVAAIILFKPSGLIFLFAVGASGAGAADFSLSPLILAHRSFCASLIRSRTAALRFLRLPVGTSGVADVSDSAGLAVGASPSTSRNALSASSIADLRRSSRVMMLAKLSVIV